MWFENGIFSLNIKICGIVFVIWILNVKWRVFILYLIIMYFKIFKFFFYVWIFLEVCFILLLIWLKVFNDVECWVNNWWKLVLYNKYVFCCNVVVVIIVYYRYFVDIVWKNNYRLSDGNGRFWFKYVFFW